ncbi:hypothetical protein [Arsenophonus apicola]|uniref:hypothetical protein n=1 Tax=Arsenophonus apicola TaxID=2879119 RepID=UPI001CDBD123|nr:hypothetical protein [Arsenophonus apicola]UBX30680.1 hypothetical protein LDL57_16125 [Arsenophonus apicola]
MKNKQIKISKADEYLEVVIPLLSEKLSTANGEKFPVKRLVMYKLNKLKEKKSN